ncbi:MAG: NAD(+)/NADH kinase [Tepidiformaceae bacterium]
MLTSVLVLHHPQSEGAAVFARQLAEELARRNVRTRVADVWSPLAAESVPGSELIVCVGGDGTVLRAARLAIPHGVPIVGVNMGRLGFLTELTSPELFKLLDRLVAMDWRVEERIMVSATLDNGDGSPATLFHGLNDIVVSRNMPGRPIYVEVRIDGALLGLYRCDGIIVSTPTGSTGYSLSAGGPILPPAEHHLVLTPVSAHLALGRSLVLEQHSEVELRVTTDHHAALSVDGQEDVPVVSGGSVIVRRSKYVTRFVSFRQPESFYGELARKLENQIGSVTNQRD